MATQELVAADAMSTVHRYIDAFNEGDGKGMAAARTGYGIVALVVMKFRMASQTASPTTTALRKIV